VHDSKNYGAAYFTPVCIPAIVHQPTWNPASILSYIPSDPTGAINLHSCIAVVSNEQERVKGHRHVFTVVMINMILHLAATSDEERDDWITAFNQFIFKTQDVCSNLADI
jgi:hypothetical protein